MTLPIPRDHRIEAEDGWQLSVLDFEPSDPPRAVAIVGHAMMVDRRTLYRADRPSLAGELVAGGIRVLLPDLRGHGASGPTPESGGDWDYDDLVSDTPCYTALARRLAPDLPVFSVGHSLAGHTTLAYLGQNRSAQLSGVVALAMCIWNARFTEGTLRRVVKRGLVEMTSAIARLWGYVPTGKLGFGTNDEAATYWKTFRGWTSGDRWSSADGVDYWASLSEVSCPVLHVVSAGDTWMARPDEALQLTEPLGSLREVLEVGRHDYPVDLEGFAPNHMQLVMDSRCRPLWRYVANWITARAAVSG